MYYFAVFKRRFSKLKANAKRKEEIIMEQKKKVYTVEEVRKILGIGKNKAYELCNNQTFSVLRIGSRILIPIRTFEDWLYSGAVL